MRRLPGHPEPVRKELRPVAGQLAAPAARFLNDH